MKKKISKVILIILIIELLLQISTPILSEAIIGTSDSRFEYTINSDNTSITIEKYIGTDTEVTIPSKIDGYDVTSIGDLAFIYCDSITSISIPGSVINIGFRAFERCEKLTSISIPKGVISIDDYAFRDCNSLTKIEVEETNTNYKSVSGILYTKDGTKLICYPAKRAGKKYTIPEGVTSIESFAFTQCSKLTNIIIPSSVTSLEDHLFYDCTSLVNITIPSSVTSIGEYAFAYCSSLKSVKIPEGVTKIEDSTFDYCSSLTSVTIPSSVTSIGNNVFYECSSLKTITIPSSVTSIGEYTFNNCNSLTKIEVDKNNTNYKSESGVLYTKDGTKLICYPAKKTGKKYTVLDGTISIESNAFNNCQNLTNITIPEGVTTIRKFAFYDSYYLTTISIPSSVTSIGSSAFFGCESLNDVTIPEGITKIESHTFHYCKSLTSINIPKSVTSIEDAAFYYCTSLINANMLDYIMGIEDSKFIQYEGLIGINIPENVTSIGNSAFGYCENLTSINIPSSVTSIGEGVFNECKNLVKIEVEESNKNYKSVNGVLYTEDETKLIYYPPKKQEMVYTILERVTSIEEHAFNYCTNLMSISIPQGVTSIGGYAFEECSSLTDIIIPGGVTKIEDGTFYRCNSLTIITIPVEVMSIGNYMFTGCDNLIIKCKSNSTAYKYALTNNISYLVDDELLTPTVLYSATTANSMKVIIKANEPIRAINGWTLSSDKMSMSKSYTSNVTENITVKDLVGNSATVQVSITNMDNTAPVATVEYSTKDMTNKDITVTIKSNEQMQELSGWTLSSDKKSMSKLYSSNTTEDITVKDLVGNSTTVKVSVTNIDKTVPTLIVEYSTKDMTNKDITVTIKSNEQMQELSGWTLSSDKKSIAKTYSTNVTEDITVKDLVGNIATAKVSITNIDKTAPIGIVEYNTTNLTNQNVIVTIKSNEQIQEVSGWTLSSDKKSMTKIYTSNVTENITVKDLLGNSTTVKISVTNIDKVLPQITNVVNGKKYSSVIPKIADDNLDKIELIKDGQTVNYINGTTIKEKGSYVLAVTDKAGNSTKVSFEIVEKVEINSAKYKVDETNKYIIGIKVGELKENIKSNLTSNIDYKILTKEGKEVQNEKIGTGMKIQFVTGEEYEIVVKGDVNGDGKVSTTDITKMKKHIIKKELLQGCYEKAGDIKEDTKISVTDLANLKKAIVGLITL